MLRLDDKARVLKDYFASITNYVDTSALKEIKPQAVTIPQTAFFINRL